MGEERPTISCSAAELAFLAGLLGANTLLGIADPFPGWLTEEIEAAWATVRGALAERRLLALQPDGRVVMDTAVAALVGTCAFPRASFIVSQTSAGALPLVRYLHLSAGLAVEQTTTGEECRLLALAGSRGLYERVLELLGLAGQAAAPGRALNVPMLTLKGAREAAVRSGAGAARLLLEQAGADGETAAALTDALARPTANGALVGLALRGAAWETGGLGLLAGPGGLWRLRALGWGEENRVEVSPCSAEGARETIRRLLNRFLPEPLAG